MCEACCATAGDDALLLLANVFCWALDFQLLRMMRQTLKATDIMAL